MYAFLTILIVIVSILLILIVLVQNSKGGGLAAGFSSSNQIMGVRKTTDFLDKATWGLAIGLVILSVISTAFIPKATSADQSEIQQEVNNAPTIDPNAVAPNFGTAQQQAGEAAAPASGAAATEPQPAAAPAQQQAPAQTGKK